MTLKSFECITGYTLINFHLPFTDTCEPFQTHFLIRVKASECSSGEAARRAGVGLYPLVKLLGENCQDFLNYCSRSD